MHLNPAAQGMTHLSAEQANGLPVAGALSGWGEFLRYLDRHTGQPGATLEQSALGQQAQGIEITGPAFSRGAPAHDVVEEDRGHYELRVSPLYDQRETLSGWLILLHDISARVQAERAVRDSEERYRAISDLTSDYVYSITITPEGDFVLDWATDAFVRFTGYSLAELSDRGGWTTLIHPDDLSRYQDRRSHILASGESEEDEYRIISYAAEYPGQPERALSAVNRRILTDTQSGQFVTVFYGILDPAAGSLVYCNAGHCPAYLVCTRDAQEGQRLARTCMPLGIVPDQTWEERTVQLDPGAVLVLYSDGITEAQDMYGAFYGEERLIASVRAHVGQPAQRILDAIVVDVDRFVGNAPHDQRDDTTLAVVVREPNKQEDEGE